MVIVVAAAVALGWLGGTALQAQMSLSLRAALLQTWHAAELRSTSGIVDCGTFRSGSGQGWGAAVGVEFPVLSPLRVELSALLSQRGGTLVTQTTFPIRDTVTGDVLDVTTEAQLESRWLVGELQPALVLPVGRRFRAVLGGRIGLPLVARFRQVEHIRSPDTVLFLMPDGRRLRTRLLAEGTFSPLLVPHVGLTAGLEHSVSIGASIRWLQRAVVEYNLTSFLLDARWRPWSARAETGIRLEIPLSSPLPVPPLLPPSPPPPPRPEPPLLSLQPAEITGYVRTGYELLATPPIVTAVFFEHDSARVPERYVRRNVPLEEIFSLDPLTAHRYVLPYVAEVLRRNPAAQVVLEGATSAEDESGGEELARQRCEAVSQALQALGVPAGRISTRWRLLPRVPSNPAYPEGRAENRRVDIVIQNAASIEYVRQQLFSEFVGVARLRIDCRSFDERASLELRASCSDTLLRLPCHDGVVELPLQCRLPAESPGLPLVVSATVPSAGTATDAHMELALQEYPRDSVLLDTRRFRAILRFDYNSSVLTSEVEERLRQLVAILPRQARVRIYGSSDALGTERRNVELTAERAQRTAEFLRRLAPGLQVQTLPLPAARKFPEDLPEGRFLNRSIWVEVEL
ncbi:MAG: OmpA family protein [Candidatus Kapabacteria bacterium]|nr:OmpA family protein [Candidatus Kapabacteria bacterium]MDW8012349.1 OmpA family protein [Bacteroidota bacterium]